MLYKPQVHFLSQIRDDAFRIVLDSLKTKRAHQVQEDQTLKALLEPGPKSAVRQLLSTLANQIGCGRFAGLLPTKPANVVLHISDLILEVFPGLPEPNPIWNLIPNTASIALRLAHSRWSVHKTQQG